MIRRLCAQLPVLCTRPLYKKITYEPPAVAEVPQTPRSIPPLNVYYPKSKPATVLPPSWKAPLVTFPALEKLMAPPVRLFRAKMTGIKYSAYKLNVAAATVLNFLTAIVDPRKAHIRRADLAELQHSQGRAHSEARADERHRKCKVPRDSRRVLVRQGSFRGQGHPPEEASHSGQRFPTIISPHDIGRNGIIKKPVSSISLSLEAKSPEEVYKLHMMGHCPPGLAAATRKKCFS